MILKSPLPANVLYRHRMKTMFRYIKKFFALFSFNLEYDEKIRIKLLVPGVESGWNSNGSFKYKNRSGENNT